MFSVTIFGAELYYILWFFFLFSLLGVVVEMVFCYAREGVIESRLGVLYLPFSPIYGVGGVVLSLYLRKFTESPVLLFLAGIVVGAVLEYVVSFVMEKAFHTVFWDYSDKPLNLHGRVCLQYAFYWGLLSLLLLYVIDPYTYAFVQLFPRDVGDGIMLVTGVLFVLSEILTMAAFTRLRHKIEALRHPDEPTSPPRALDRLIDRLAPDPVVINTFPRMSLVLDYLALTGQQRRWIRVPLRLGKVSALHRRMREHAIADGTNLTPVNPHDPVSSPAVEVLVLRLDPELEPPGYAHPGDAGADLRARESVELGPGERRLVPTGIAIAVPEGYAAFVHPRSGLAARHGISIVNAPGTIDAGYRGEVSVCLVNTDRATPVRIARGDRIAQLVVQPVSRAAFVTVTELPDSSRGAGGYGSTGTV